MNTVTLLILDGWGQAPSWGGNAITQAVTPNYDKLWRAYPHCLLGASGTDVGLPGHEAGNSEVGHLNIGLGRIIYEDITRINQTIADKSIFYNPILLEAVKQVKKNSSKLHLMGLVSDGGVHSHIIHLYALLEFAKEQGLKEVYIHAFTDGRDADPMSSITYIAHLEKKIAEIGIGQIATISGRYYAMDRDHHWERIQLAYQAMTDGKGLIANSALSAISQSYSHGITDEFIRPTVITKNNQPISQVSDQDSLIFFNFRSDRARQITKAFVSNNFTEFSRKKINNLFFVSLIPYGSIKEIGYDVKSAFAPKQVQHSLAEVLSDHKLKQFHIAETEKYAHVTYFFNGGREEPYPAEERLLVPSPRVATYDLAPEMSLNSIVKNVLERLKTQKYDFMVVNFANADMVGHTGNFKATISACEAIDQALEEIFAAISQQKGLMIITADHGNADEILNAKNSQPNTEHSINPVPFIFIDKREKPLEIKLRPKGILADIAPTILQIMHLSQPKEMTGNSLIE